MAAEAQALRAECKEMRLMVQSLFDEHRLLRGALHSQAERLQDFQELTNKIEGFLQSARRYIPSWVSIDNMGQDVAE